MQAIVLAGGTGTRLLPYTTVLPKPLMPVGKYPVLEIMLRQLKRAGCREAILAVGYLSHLIESYFGDGERLGMKVSYSHEEEAMGTAGPLSLLMDRLEDDFLVTNGDLLTTLNWKALMAYHRAHGGAATIGMFTRKVHIDFGVIETDDAGLLRTYTEKPTYSFDVSMGVNVFNREAIAPFIEAKRFLNIPDLMLGLRDKGEAVHCYKEDCEWLDIGRVDDYEVASKLFVENEAAYFGER